MAVRLGTIGGVKIEGRVRPAALDDVDRIAACHLACWRETYVDLLTPDFIARQDVTERAAFWRSALADPTARSAVAEINGKLIGFAHAVARNTPTQESDVELSAIYVRKAFHGTGTGQLLFDIVVGDRPCSLWVAEVNPKAHAFLSPAGVSL